ncbi:MAG: hypothetical protein Q7S53_01495 [bacterium]|nr:hypothetical protein [bacterium]
MGKPKEIDYGFKINHKKLWALSLPVEELDLSELQYNFDIFYLEKENTDDWNLSINQLLANLAKEPTHAKKMDKADLKYPLEIYLHRNKWIVLDGIHRLAKAKSLGYKKIMVRRVPKNLLEQIKE